MPEILDLIVLAKEQDMMRKHWLVARIKITEESKTRQSLEKHVKHGNYKHNLVIQIADLMVTTAEIQTRKAPSGAM
jgi:transcription antitermination factor NusG